MTWPHVAAEYGALFSELCSARTARAGDLCLRRARRRRSRRSIISPCCPTTSASSSTPLEDVPNRETGYCTDDVSRAFMVALAHWRGSRRRDRASRVWPRIYLSFLQHAQLDDGRFHNFMAYDRRWLDEIGTHDSCGRAIWALGYGVRHAPSTSWRRRLRARCSIARCLSLDGSSTSVRALTPRLGLAHALAARQDEPRTRRAALSRPTRLLAAYDEQRRRRLALVRDRHDLRQRAPCPKRCFAPGRRLPTQRYVDAGACGASLLRERHVRERHLRADRQRRLVPARRARARATPSSRWKPPRWSMRSSRRSMRPAMRRTSPTPKLALAWYYGKNSRGVTHGPRRRLLRRPGGRGASTTIWAPNRRWRCSPRPTRWPQRRPRALRAVR